MVTADQHGTDVLVAPDIGVGHGVLQSGHRIHGLAAFGFLGVINDQES